MSMRPFKWILLGPVLALLLLNHSLGAGKAAPDGQPAQMSSRVGYDSNLTDPFFESNAWVEQDGTPTNESGPPHLKQTANCFSDSQGEEHTLQFCEATLLDVNMIDLSIYELSPTSYYTLMVEIRNGMFACQFSVVSVVYSTEIPIWTTKRQELTLDKKVYRRGDVIKGRLEFECEEKCGRDTCTIKINGVFKTIVE